ncbi:hypothetical protein [Alkalisalibacterium limincola]|uniref:hypothetical protein n=1 Tax=Alkalisalibacterium limincola TaxID=2699169 RepID=UPI0016503371|nr:hypothetical protein [Alkalisalibacterium limincola]
MGEQGYRRHPDQIDMARAERCIRQAGLVSLVLLAAAVPIGYFVLPLVFTFPEALAERMAFAAQASVFVLLCVVVAIGMVSTGRRFSAATSVGPRRALPARRSPCGWPSSTTPSSRR